MEKKATHCEHLPMTSGPQVQNVRPEGSTELNNDSCNFVNLVSHGRMHDDFIGDGDLHRKSLLTRHPSYSDFTGNPLREAQSTQFQQSAQSAYDSFQPYSRGVGDVDDGTVGTGCQFDSMLPLKIWDVNEPVGFNYFTRGKLVNSSMSSNVFQLASLLAYPQIPAIGSSIMGGNYQFDKNCGPMLGRKYPGLKENEHVQFGNSNQGEYVNNNMLPNSLQLADLHSSTQLCSGLASVFQSNEGRRKFASLSKSNDHQHHLAYGDPFIFTNENNSVFMIQSGGRDGQTFDLGQNQHSIFPWISTEPHAGLVSNFNDRNDVYYIGGGGYNQLSMLTGMPTNGYGPGEDKNSNAPCIGLGPLMHDRSINPTSSSNIMHNLPTPEQNGLQMMQNRGSDYHAAPTGILGDGDNMTVHDLAWHAGMSGVSVSVPNVPQQLFLAPVQRVYQNNMRTSVANPFAAQMVGPHSLSGQNMRNPGSINFANYYHVSGQHEANYSQGPATEHSVIQDSKHLHANKGTLLQPPSEGLPRDPALGLVTTDGDRIDWNAGETQTTMVKLARPSSKGFPLVTTQGQCLARREPNSLGGCGLALQNAPSTAIQASNVAVNPSAQASGTSKSSISRSGKRAQTVSGRKTFVQALKGEVAPDPVRGKAPAETLLKCSKSQRPTEPSSSVQKRASDIPGLNKMDSSASIYRQPDVIRCSSGDASGSGSLVPLGARCDLCNIDLAFMPTGEVPPSGNPPVSSVHPCGHRFHDSCLREVGVTTEACDEPFCVACGFTPDQVQNPGRR